MLKPVAGLSTFEMFRIKVFHYFYNPSQARLCLTFYNNEPERKIEC